MRFSQAASEIDHFVNTASAVYHREISSLKAEIGDYNHNRLAIMEWHRKHGQVVIVK